MYCPNCGAQNEETYNNCIFCGKYIADINENLRRKRETQDAVEPETVEVIPNIEDVIKPEGFKEPENEGIPEKKYSEPPYRQYVKEPKKYFILSVLCTIFGSLGFGIAAIVFSVMTKAEISSGNIKKATVYSENTKMFCIFSVLVGIIKYIFIAILFSTYFTTMNYYYSPFMW